MSCSHPSALLRDGECVGECGAGFYSQAGVCYGKKNRKKLPDLCPPVFLEHERIVVKWFRVGWRTIRSSENFPV